MSISQAFTPGGQEGGGADLAAAELGQAQAAAQLLQACGRLSVDVRRSLALACALGVPGPQGGLEQQAALQRCAACMLSDACAAVGTSPASPHAQAAARAGAPATGGASCGTAGRSAGCACHIRHQRRIHSVPGAAAGVPPARASQASRQ